MEAVDTHMLSEWLRSKASIPSDRASLIAESLVNDGWSSQQLLLAELRAPDGDKDAFLGKLALRGDRRRLLIALEALEKRVEDAESELREKEEADNEKELDEKESEMLEWLEGLGIQHSHASEYAPLFVAEGLDDTKILNSERKASGDDFLSEFVSRRGDARRFIDALSTSDFRDRELEALRSQLDRQL